MNEQQAIINLKNLFSEHELALPNTDSLETLHLAISALEKQIPRKPNIGNDNGKERKCCGNCGCFYLSASKYCSKCGQKIRLERITMKSVLEKIIDRLEKECDRYFEDNSDYGSGKWCGFYEALYIVIRAAEEYKEKNCSKCSRRKFYQLGYKDGKNEDGWIPASSGKLPKSPEYDWVLVQIDIGKKPRIAELRSDGHWWTDDDSNSPIDTWCEVIAWQPLPEPYQPKETEV